MSNIQIINREEDKSPSPGLRVRVLSMFHSLYEKGAEQCEPHIFMRGAYFDMLKHILNCLKRPSHKFCEPGGYGLIKPGLL